MHSNAHTPYLERALIEQDAVMLINQSGGEVPQLAMGQIHALVFAREFAEAIPSTVTAMTRAIYRAQQLIHGNHAAAVEALMNEFPTMSRRHVDAIVGVYESATPPRPRFRSMASSPG